MRIEGSWLTCADGVERPVVPVRIPTTSGAITRNFLVDSGADRTVLCRDALDALGLPSLPATTGVLAGVGGQAGSVVVGVSLELTSDAGTVTQISGSFPAFLAPDASDIDILGREVLNLFDVILSYPRREVLLLAPAHSYQVIAP
jgi:hypothetical protein